MHKEAKDWFKSVKRQHPNHFVNKKVLDCGSLDINGSLRDLFQSCEYVGVDIRKGKNVDVVSTIHDLEWRNGYFDTAVSAEMLEHDQHYRRSILRMYDLLKPGGLLAISCAGYGRAEHGTRRTGDEWGTSPNYYRNIHGIDLSFILNEERFKTFTLCYKEKDLYYVGLKR